MIGLNEGANKHEKQQHAVPIAAKPLLTNGGARMITAIELRNRITEYRARAVKLQSDAPNCQSKDTREAMLYFADGYEYMADMMENSQETEERPLLN